MRTTADCHGRFVFLLAATLISAVTCVAQSNSSNDLNQKLSFHVALGRIEGTFVGALGEVARVFNIPMGISWVNTANSEQNRVVEYRDATVLEIIQDIARTEPGYEVRIANNVVHVITTDVPFSQNFLNVNIPQFAGTGVAGVVKAGLWMLLNQQIAPNPPKGYAASIASSSSDPKLNLDFKNTSVEEILDAVAVASEEKVWVVTFSQDPNPIPTGFRRTESFTSKMSPGDNDQPIWDIFRWDYWPIKLVPAPNKN